VRITKLKNAICPPIQQFTQLQGERARALDNDRERGRETFGFCLLTSNTETLYYPLSSVSRKK
jgi:hypothetical protein